MIRWLEVTLSYPCPVCPAGPGDRCLTQSGRTKWECHAARTDLARANGWRFPDKGLD